MTDKMHAPLNEMNQNGKNLLFDSGSRVRCYETGSAAVTGVCHHCGRFLARHSAVEPAFYQDHSLELKDILPGREARGRHCRTHAHLWPYSPRKVLFFFGSLIVAWGLGWLVLVLLRVFSLGGGARTQRIFDMLPRDEALIFLAPLLAGIWAAASIPLAILIIGLGIIAVGRHQGRVFDTRSMGRPLAAIPLLSESYRVSIAEEAEVKMTLNSNQEAPCIEVVKGHGKFAVEIYLKKEDIERSQTAYKQKGEKYGFPAGEMFDLGWLSVTESPYTTLDLNQRIISVREPTSSFEQFEAANWYSAAKHTYDIKPEAFFTRAEMPDSMKRALLWVRPTLKKFSGGHTLQIEFDILTDQEYLHDWRYHQTDEDRFENQFWKDLSQARLEYVHVKVNKNPFPYYPDRDEGGRGPILKSRGRISRDPKAQWLEVQWQNIGLETVLTGQPQNMRSYYQQKDYPLTITFTQPLTEMQTPFEISFGLLVESASLSGLKVDRHHFWLPNGRPLSATNRNFSIINKTHLRGTLTVDPNIFAFQSEITASETIPKKQGLPLTSEVVTRLVKRLEDEQLMHVKSVAKSTPIAESENDLAYERVSWNILGRVYRGNNHPIDVYILLVGRTPLAEGQTMNWGNITYRCLQTNQGPHNRSGKDLENEIKGRCRSLCENLRGLLQPASVPPDWQTVAPRILGQT